MNIGKLCLLIIISTQFMSAFSELITLGIGALAIGAAYHSYCKLTECCTDDYIPYDIGGLEWNLKQNVFGQPLAMNIISMLKGHKSKFESNHKKALSISLYGWPGTGKNYVASFIAKALFKKGMESKYVKMYIGRSDFPNKLDVLKYQSMLVEDITRLVKSCDKSLIIFDEVNDIPAGTLNVLKPFMDYHDKINGVDFGNVVFLFLSNINGNEIADQFLKLNKDRNSIKMADFEPILRQGSYDKGGFTKSDLIYAQLIDHYIPFIPLEQVHVEQCIIQEFSHVNNHNPSQDMIDEVMSIISFGPKNNPIFANAGCKRIRNQVSFVQHMYQQKILMEVTDALL